MKKYIFNSSTSLISESSHFIFFKVGSLRFRRVLGMIRKTLDFYKLHFSTFIGNNFMSLIAVLEIREPLIVCTV